MRGDGEALLAAAVRYTHDGLADVNGWAWNRWLAQAVNGNGRSDARAVAKPLARLVLVGLLERKVVGNGGSRSVFFRPTPRGHEVDEILGQSSVDRGGKFVPLKDTGLSWDEIRAVQR